MRGILRVTWTVTPLWPPVARRHCSNCNRPQRFRTSGKFRVNAQKKRIDVWLLYRCEICEANWNLPIVERALVTAIDPAALCGFMQNEEGLARRHGFDLERLRRHGAQIEACQDFDVRKIHANGCRHDPEAIEVTLRANEPCELRLDQFLAGEFRVSRSCVARLADRGVLTIFPAARKGLRAALADGQVIRLRLEQVDSALALTLTRAAVEDVSRVSL